jgi:hypothetical protein
MYLSPPFHRQHVQGERKLLLLGVVIGFEYIGFIEIMCTTTLN